MNAKTCPDQESLRKLLLGELRGPHAEQLEEHLLDCNDCSAAADTISASDELTAAIQSPDVVHGESDIVAKVIQRGKLLRSQAETVDSYETITSDSARQAENAPDASSNSDETNYDEEIDFLAPAEEADEIGRLGDYRVLEVLGIGGMGVVFRAEDPKLKRQIALKAMKPVVAASKSAKDRFIREAQATAAIEHDNIVHIYQVGEDRNIPFIAMQFLRGESLQKRLDREKQIDQREVLRIGREVAAGLAAAHKRELVHRDIKPDNIWIEEETGRAKILDFGLVRTYTDDAGLTQSGMVLGTPRYMAPEQALGQSVDHRCDLFSLGSVLYHLATGKAPFEGGNLTATLIAVAQKDPDPVEHVCPRIQPALSRLIMRLLSKDRDQRLQSAAEVSEAIADIERELDAEEAENAKQQQVAETIVLKKSPVAKPEPRGKSRSPIFLGGAVVTIALAVFAWLYFAGFILKVESEHGTLIVKVTGDEFETAVKGKKITITNSETNQTFTIDLNSTEVSESLKPGTYFMLETDSGLTTPTDRFTISSGVDQVVEVTWKPKAQGTKTQIGGDHVEPDAVAMTSEADRRGAEWVRSINTHRFTYIVIRQNGVERKIGHEELKSESALPTEPFELTTVYLQFNHDLTDAGLVNLKDCRHLTLLNFTFTGIGDAGLVHLQACCPNLQELHLPRGVSDVGLANFKECRELRRLSLFDVKASTAGLDNFRHCKKLTSLALPGVDLTGDSLESFAGCTELEHLNLASCRLDPAELAHFKDCTKLKDLELRNNPAITNKGLGYFQNCRELTTLNLASSQVDDEGLSFLSDFKKLKSLRVVDTIVSDAFLESLQAKLPNCKISGRPREPSPAEVADPDRRGAEWVRSINDHHFTYIVIRQNGVERKIGHEELKSDSALPTEPFELTGVFLQYNRGRTGEGLVNLRDCRHLTFLNFTYTSIGDVGLVHLKACCPNLRELHLAGGVTDAGLANFKECRELRRLTLHGSRASTAGLDNFRNCKKLTSLSLGGVKLAGVSLESFAGCLELEHLILKNCGMNPAELVHFKDCRNLKQVDLSGNPAITKKDLGHLQNCLELTGLDLTGANVDDEGLAFLLNCQRLTGLGVGGTNVSEAFLESLRAKLPNCKINGKPKLPSPAGNLE